MKYILGLTGPTGSGKTTATKVAENLGWYVINCDKLVHTAYENEVLISALTSAFGSGILTENKINRKELGKIAFSSKENTNLLNKTVLPFILEVIKEEISSAKSEKILLDAPTLFESGANRLCSSTCAILSSYENRLARILSRDNITPENAKARMEAGKSDEYYKAQTRHIIYNNGEEKALIEEFSRLLNKLGG